MATKRQRARRGICSFSKEENNYKCDTRDETDEN